MLEYIIYAVLFVMLYFEVFLLVSFIEKTSKKTSKESAKSPSLPTVGIIVPCWNEEMTIKKTLDSLLRLNYPKKLLQIVVIDDGSTDNTYKIAKNYERHSHIKVYTKPNGGKHSALNFGAKLLDSQIIGALDADTTVAPDALLHIVKHFADKNVAAVVPAIKVQEPKNLLQKAQQVEYTLSIFLRNVFSHIDSLFITPGPFSFFRHDVLKKLGYWKSAYLTEDLEMGLRLQSHKYKLVNEPKAHVYTNTPDTIKALIKQRLRWSYGFLKNIIDYRFMLFNKKYGHLGLFVLPFAFASVFFAMFLAALLIYNTAIYLTDKILELVFAGVVFEFSFDWYYFMPAFVTILGAFAFGLILISTIIGSKIANSPFSKSGLVYYATMYTFLAPIWLAKAVNKAYIKKTTISWR